MKRLLFLALLLASVCDLKSQTPTSVKQLSDFVADSIKRRPDRINAGTLSKAFQGLVAFSPDVVQDTSNVFFPLHGQLRFQRKDSAIYVYDTIGIRRWRRGFPGIGIGLVTSVFGRTGVVTAVENDYSAFYPRFSQTYMNPSWIGSLNYDKIVGAPWALPYFNGSGLGLSANTFSLGGTLSQTTTFGGPHAMNFGTSGTRISGLGVYTTGNVTVNAQGNNTIQSSGLNFFSSPQMILEGTSSFKLGGIALQKIYDSSEWKPAVTNSAGEVRQGHWFGGGGGVGTLNQVLNNGSQSDLSMQVGTLYVGPLNGAGGRARLITTSPGGGQFNFGAQSWDGSGYNATGSINFLNTVTFNQTRLIVDATNGVKIAPWANSKAGTLYVTKPDGFLDSVESGPAGTVLTSNGTNAKPSWKPPTGTGSGGSGDTLVVDSRPGFAYRASSLPTNSDTLTQARASVDSNGFLHKTDFASFRASYTSITSLGDSGIIFVRHNGTRDTLIIGASSSSGGAASWGSISGTLSAQSDLQSALNGKASATHSHVIADVTGLQTALDSKQATLVSGTNIKTINGSSILGSGDLTVSGGSATPAGSDGEVQFNLSGVFGTISGVNYGAAQLRAPNFKSAGGYYFNGGETMYISGTSLVATDNAGNALEAKWGRTVISNTFADVAPLNGLFVKGAIKNNYLAGTGTRLVQRASDGTLEDAGIDPLAVSQAITQASAASTEANNNFYQEVQFSGDGSTTSFVLTISGTATWASATPSSSAAAAPFYVTVGASNVTVHFTTAPATGTNNIKLFVHYRK